MVFRSRYSRTIVAELAVLPGDVRQRAITLANQHGDFATTEEMEGEQVELAAAGQATFEFVDSLDEVAEMDQAFRESERLNMLEGMHFKLRGAITDAAHGGSMTRSMIIGMLKLWFHEGVGASMYSIPQPLRNGRSVYLVVIRSSQRLFCADFQLELTVNSDGASYAANVILEDATGDEVLPHTLPDAFSSWLIAVLKGFCLAAQRLDAMQEPSPLADSPDWTQIAAVFGSASNTPRR